VVALDEDATARRGQPPADDARRLAALHRVAAAAPSVALATGGALALNRLLDGIRWKPLARSVQRGMRWVGHGEFSALQLALLAHTGAGSWSGPMACGDFGRSAAEGGVDEVTRDCFVEALDGSLEALGFRTGPGFDGLGVRGTLWGGELAVLLSLLGTPHWPAAAARGGVLFVEAAQESPARVERGLVQLRQAGVLQAQKAVLLGALGAARASARQALLASLRHGLRTPLLDGLPGGPGQPRLMLPLGRRVQLAVQGRDVLIAW
jgi:muramoyltetrapeptide carboxypeptidase